jgi:hypothetical protein
LSLVRTQKFCEKVKLPLLSWKREFWLFFMDSLTCGQRSNDKSAGFIKATSFNKTEEVEINNSKSSFYSLIYPHLKTVYEPDPSRTCRPTTWVKFQRSWPLSNAPPPRMKICSIFAKTKD